MYMLGAIFWLALSALLAWGLAKALFGWTRYGKNKPVRWVTATVLLPVVFIAPLADEIVGKRQFDQLCEAARDVKIYGTIPVGEELYTPDGKWRIGTGGKDVERAYQVYESIVRWDLGSPYPEEIAAAIPIRKSHTRLFNKSTGALLAEWDQYGTTGGWLSRSVETPFLVRAQCVPQLRESWALEQRILPFQGNRGEVK